MATKLWGTVQDLHRTAQFASLVDRKDEDLMDQWSLLEEEERRGLCKAGLEYY